MTQPTVAAQTPFPHLLLPPSITRCPSCSWGLHPCCRSRECLCTALQKHCTVTATTCNATTMHYSCHPGATERTRTVSHMPCREAPALANPGKKRNKPHTNSGIARHSPTFAVGSSNTRECCLKQSRLDLMRSCFTGVSNFIWRTEGDASHGPSSKWSKH